MKLYAHDTQKQEDVLAGYLVERTFVKKVDSRKHLLKKWKAYGIQQTVIKQLKENGIEDIEIREKDTGNVYRCSLRSFLRGGYARDFGSGEQVFMPIKKMQASFQPRLI